MKVVIEERVGQILPLMAAVEDIASGLAPPAIQPQAEQLPQVRGLAGQCPFGFVMDLGRR